jgi:hypothetical protein
MKYRRSNDTGSVLDMDMQGAKALKSLRIRIVISRSETPPKTSTNDPELRNFKDKKNSW